jgi:CheY-like chemotaxis protein
MSPLVVSPHSPQSPFSALVVEPNEVDLVRVVSVLAGAGFTVTATDNYQDARNRLAAAPPLVLVTEIRLGAFNGLQLALRAEAAGGRRVSVVVTSAFPDPVLQRDADRVGATFALKPLTAAALLAAVYRTAMRRPYANGALEPIRPPFERRSGERRIASLVVEFERRSAERRRGIANLMLRATALS